MAVPGTAGDVKVTYGNFTGASGGANVAITDYQNRMANFPFTYKGSGLENVFPTVPIKGKTISFIRYLGGNNMQRRGPEGVNSADGVLESWDFSASSRESVRVPGTISTHLIDFAIQDGEDNLSQTLQSGEDIMRRTREAMENKLVDITFEELSKASYMQIATPVENRFLGTVPAATKWDDENKGRVTTGDNVGWNIDKLSAARFGLAKNRVDSMDGNFVCLASLDSLEGFTVTETMRNQDYGNFVDSVFGGGKQMEFFRMAPGYNFNSVRFVAFPHLLPNDDGTGRGIPCTGTGTDTVYNEYVIHPRCVRYLKPADEPMMNIMSYYDKNTYQVRFRGRMLCGFMVHNPTGIVRVLNKTNISSLGQPTS